MVLTVNKESIFLFKIWQVFWLEVYISKAKQLPIPHFKGCNGFNWTFFSTMASYFFKIDFIWLGLQTVNDDEPETWRDLVWDFSKVNGA